MKFLTLVITLFALPATGADECAEPVSCEGEEIAVFGHRSPDTDAVSSAIIYTWELRTPVGTAKAKCAKAYVNTDDPNRETTFFLSYFNFSAPPIIKNVEETMVFATVDTNNIDEMPDGANKTVANKLHSIVDHHKLTGLETTNPVPIDIRPLGSAGSVLYQRSLLAGRTIPGEGCSENIAGLMMATILSDTLGFRSPTTTDLDRAAVEYLAPLAGVDNVTQFADQMMEASANITGLSAHELVMLDSKVYSFVGPDEASFKLRISVMETVRPENLFAISEDLSTACDGQLSTDQKGDPAIRAVLFFAIDIIGLQSTFIPSSSSYATSLVLDGGFPEAGEGGDLINPQQFVLPVELPNGQKELPTVLSRKKQIIPGITLSTGTVGFDDSGDVATKTGNRYLRR
jgi:manganese-dependent inorganic pyrophosphatase